MVRRALFAYCLFVLLSRGPVCAAEADPMAAVVSQLASKMDAVSSLYFEYSACERCLKSGKPTSPLDASTTTGLSQGKVWYEKPLRMRVEVVSKVPNNTEIPSSKHLEISDGRVMRSVSYYLANNKTPAVVNRYDLDRVRGANLNPAAAIRKPRDVLPMIEREYRKDPTGWRIMAKEKVGDWPCLRIRRERKLPPQMGLARVETTDYFLREDDGICVRSIVSWDVWRHEWTVTKVLVNCAIPPEVYVFGSETLEVTYKERDRTDALIKDLSTLGPGGP